MKNFTNNFKQFTSRLSARWLIMALMLLLGTSSAWGWGFKYDDGGSWNTCSSSNFDNTTFYTDPTGSSTTSVYIKMHTGLVKTGFNITQNDGCDGQKLYVNLSGVASTSSNTIVRASARWVNNKGIYSEYTIVIPDGKIYIKPTNGDAVLMTKSTYTYTAELTLSDAKTFDLYADDPGNSIIENQEGMPSAGKPTSVRLNYTGLTSPYQYVKVTYNLKTNQITFEEMTPPCEPPSAPELTNPAAQCGGSITLPAKDNNKITLKWYDAQTGGNVVSNTEITATGTYWAAAVTECESTSRTAYTVTINPIPEVNSLLSTLNICIGSIDETDLTTLSNVEVSSGSTAVWYTSKDGVELAERANLINGGTYWVAAENSTTGCKSTTRTSFTININNLPEAPSLGKDEYETCAHASNTVNLDELAATNNVVWYIGETEVDDPGQISLATAGTFIYTAKAMNQEGCQSATGAEFKLTVKPLPTITGISVNNSTPVINEDVLLTVEGGDIARVEWSITSGKNASLSDASGNSVKLTSTASGAVTVTATAISANGCTSTSTKEVTFKAVDECISTTETIESKNIEIWCRETGNSKPGDNLTCYAWIDGTSTKLCGDTGSTTNTTKTSNIEGSQYTYRVWTIDMTNYANKTVNVIFKKGTNTWDGQTNDLTAGTRNNRYYFVYDSDNPKDNSKTKQTKSESLTTTNTIPAPVTAPAVKTVSATSVEGSGIVTFTGKVLKTGCANGDAIWVGYQYKKANEEWPSSDVTAGSKEKQLVSIRNNPGSEDFTAEVNVEGLEDGDYHFRAYVINGYGRSADANNYDQGVYYGLDKLVTVSTVQTAVKTATITLTDEKGNEVDKNKKYCVGETGYIKVTSDVKYTTIKWKTDKGTEIEETGNNGIYPFVAKGDDNIWVMLSNKHNDIDRPAINQEPLVVNTFADPILPRVSLNKVSICSNDAVGATVKLTNVVKGQTYQLYQQIENGDDTFTEQAIGEAKTQTEDVTDKTELVLHTLTNTAATGKYFVKTYTTVCEENIVATQPFTFTVVDAAEVFISIDPASAETTPWMPAKFTVNASDKYTLNVTKGNPAEPATEVEVNQNGNKVSVKIPLPEGTQHVTGQYQNVTFPQGATTQYTITATLSAAGGDNPCAAPTSATINLVPYVEECTKGH